MAEPLLRALTRVRGLLLDERSLVRAVASGRQKARTPRWRRVELRYVDLKAGRRLQVTAYDQTQAHTANHEPGKAAAAAVDDLLDEPFGNWHVETGTETHQLRVTRRLEAMVHTSSRSGPEPGQRQEHDRQKTRLLSEDDPVLAALGFVDEHGRVKPSRQAKYRQVEEFLRDLAPVVDAAVASGRLRPTPERPLRVVDLGCGNAYLTFAAHRFLTHVRGLPVHTTGVDVKAQSREHNSALADALGLAETMMFVQGDIGTAELEQPPDVVLALHACDTATDDALAKAVEWQAPVVLAAPCCHHDVQRQLDAARAAGEQPPAPHAALVRHPILRERFADVLTDTFRAQLLRLAGYSVDVVEFVDSRHTPRNALIRASRRRHRKGPDDALAAALAGLGILVATPATAAGKAEPDVDRPVRDARISESSGLAVSPQHAGVLWTHDDSGNPPLLFALGRNGRVAGTVRVRGVANFDWEAMAAFRDRTGRALLAVADVGDNNGTRRAPEIDVVPEPARLGTTETVPLLRLRLTYPDGARDAEALLVDTARGRMFVVTKGLFSGEVYAVPAAAWNGTAPRRPTERPARLVKVGTVPLGLVTDGAVAPGGAVLLRTYSDLAAFAPFPLDPGDAALRPEASLGLPSQPQGEGLALSADGRSVLVSSEGAGEPVQRVDLPAPLRAVLAASGGGTGGGTGGGPGPTPRRTPSPPAASTPATSTATGRDGLPWGALALGGAVVAMAALALGRRRR